MASFRKKDNERKKREKREEKQKRREERLLAGPASHEDMIAYVDHLGNIVDTPPEPQLRKKIKAEDILISIPRKEDVETEPQKGHVAYFNADKGYGFIKEIESAVKYFFHISSVSTELSEGNLVTFELERGPRGMNAVSIALAN